MGLGNFKPRFYFLSAIFITAILVALIFSLSSPKKEALLATRQVLGAHTPRLNATNSALIVIRDDKKEWQGKTSQTGIEDILNNLNVHFYEEDLIKCFPDPALKIGTIIEIKRAPIVYLNDGGINKELRSWAKIVEDFLIDKKIELSDKDKISVDKKREIKNGMKITITRVGERDVEETAAIPFTTIKVADSNMLRGTTKIKQYGKNGEIIKKYHVIYENGVQISKDLISEKVIKKPEVKIIAYGTRSMVTVRCRYNDYIEDAASKYGLDPNDLCRTMMCESGGNPYSYNSNYGYSGLFQYNPYFWSSISAQAGFPGASIWDPRAQIYVTAWAWAHGYRGRWPNC